MHFLANVHELSTANQRELRVHIQSLGFWKNPAMDKSKLASAYQTDVHTNSLYRKRRAVILNAFADRNIIGDPLVTRLQKLDGERGLR